MMNEINKSLEIFAKAEIDWSPDAGMFWLTAMVLILGIVMAVAYNTE